MHRADAAGADHGDARTFSGRGVASAGTVPPEVTGRPLHRPRRPRGTESAPPSWRMGVGCLGRQPPHVDPQVRVPPPTPPLPVPILLRASYSLPPLHLVASYRKGPRRLPPRPLPCHLPTRLCCPITERNPPPPPPPPPPLPLPSTPPPPPPPPWPRRRVGKPVTRDEHRSGDSLPLHPQIRRSLRGPGTPRPPPPPTHLPDSFGVSLVSPLESPIPPPPISSR